MGTPLAVGPLHLSCPALPQSLLNAPPSPCHPKASQTDHANWPARVIAMFAFATHHLRIAITSESMRSTPNIRSLSKRIADRSRALPLAPGRATAGLNRATVVVLRDDIRLALRDGWSMRQVWLTLREEGRLDFGYQAFRRHVRLLALSTPTSVAVLPASTTPISGLDVGAPRRPSTESTPGFRFDPQPDPREVF